MEAPIIAAVVGAFALLIGVFINQGATFGLKYKEFRVMQIRSWIDALEQASVYGAVVTSTGGNEPEPDQRDRLGTAISGIANGMINRIDTVERLYESHKLKLTPKDRTIIEALLKECNSLRSTFLLSTITNQNVRQNLMAAEAKSRELEHAYENARSAVLERLYVLLKHEIRFDPTQP